MVKRNWATFRSSETYTVEEESKHGPLPEVRCETPEIILRKESIYARTSGATGTVINMDDEL